MKTIPLSFLLLALLASVSSIQVLAGFDYQKQDIPIQQSGQIQQNAKQVPQLQIQPQKTTVTNIGMQVSPQEINPTNILEPTEGSIEETTNNSDNSMNTPNIEDNEGPPEIVQKKQIILEQVNPILASMSNAEIPKPLPTKPQEINYDKAVRLLHENIEEQNLEIASIVVTTFNGGSYDELFRVVKQRSAPGSRTLVYEVEPSLINIFQSKLRDAVYDASFQGRSVLDLMINRILGLSQKCPQCVVFNWECSSGYAGRNFPEGSDKVLKFTKFIIQRGHIAMFSDFSLKALIKQWDTQLLGPNPFEQVGGTSRAVDLSFDRQALFDSPSTQLHAIAQLAENQVVKVSVLGNTIVYRVKQNREQTDKYQLKVLTQALGYERDIFPSAGHVLLKYASGGYLLTSMVHWIELSRIDTSAERYFEAANKLYGNEASLILQQTYQALPQEKQAQFIQSNSALLVQDQSPAFNSFSLAT